MTGWRQYPNLMRLVAQVALTVLAITADALAFLHLSRWSLVAVVGLVSVCTFAVSVCLSSRTPETTP